jgi:hypothetical protein
LNNPINSETHFTDHHLDLPSINFEHFIETPKQHENNRKRVCIITDQPLTTNVYDQVDNISDFIDSHLITSETNGHNGLLKAQSPSNDLNFYKDLTGSPIECRKPAPPGKNLDYNG